MESFDKFVIFVAERLKMLGAAFLFAMAVLTCVDVVGRLLGHPIFGAVELVSFMGVFAVALALPITQVRKGHVGVELLTSRLPARLRLFLFLCTESLSLALFVVVTWRMFLFGGRLKTSGEVSMNLHLPEYVIVYVLACCCAVLCLVFFSSILKTFRKFLKS
ncbi:MAG: TRAP transporter small permease [Desulforhopalus sp.]|nr:TRAP transporter small permease [Desulforhopalus sp.]